MGSPSLKNEKKRGRGYSPHRTSSATKQEDRVLGPYLPTKKALTSAATLHKDHQNATKCLLVPAPRKAPGATSSEKNLLVLLPRTKLRELAKQQRKKSI